MKKIIKRIILGFLCLLLVLVIGVCVFVGVTWGSEISTVMSIKLLNEENKAQKAAPVYEMNVSGGYYFDKFIKQGGASSDQELIDFIVGNLTKGIVPITLNAPTIGCSSFTAIDENGHRLFGRNYDFSTTTAMLVKTNPGGGRYKSISSVDLQFLGISDGVYLNSFMQKIICLAAPYVPLDGINECGVACGIYMTYQGDENGVYPTNQDTDRPDITSTTLLRMILDYADSVDKAVELASSYDLHDSASTSFHYMVADSTGKSAILEWVNGTSDTDGDGTLRNLNVIYNDSDSALGEMEEKDNFQYVTNFILTPGYFSSNEGKYGLDRYNKIREMTNPTNENVMGNTTYQNALDVLKMVGRRNWDLVNGVTDGNGITVWSALYDLTNKTLTWVSNEQFDNEKAIFTYSL